MRLHSIHVRPADAGTAQRVARNIRPLDRTELWFSSGREDMGPLLEDAIWCSLEAHEALCDDRTLCVFGVGQIGISLSDGAPWMVGTQLLDQHPQALAKMSREWITHIRPSYRRLYNYVWDEHKEALRWLQWLGFEMGAPEPRGPFSKLFRRFEMKGGLVHV